MLNYPNVNRLSEITDKPVSVQLLWEQAQKLLLIVAVGRNKKPDCATMLSTDNLLYLWSAEVQSLADEIGSRATG